MLHNDRFRTTDDLIRHLQGVVHSIPDEELKAKYAGFVAASAVTVYELAIRDIFISFAERKKSIFGVFVRNHFSQINGRIKIDEIRKNINLFGEKYLNKFKKKLDERNMFILNVRHNNIEAVYGNLIACRHAFIHSNNTTMTFDEVIEAYTLGKEIIAILSETMQR